MSWNTLLIWSLITLLIAISAVWLDAAGMSLAKGSLLPTLLPTGIALIVAWIYTRVRPDPRIATLAHITGVGMMLAAVTYVLSYLTVTTGQPLIDPQLVALDQATGLDWPTMYKWIAAHPWIYEGLKLAYLGLMLQLVLLEVILTFRGQVQRAWELLWLFTLSCIGCLIASAIWPAQGAFAYFHFEMSQPYVHDFMALRNGTLKVIGDPGVQGVIQFPSLHMGLVVLYTYGARGIRFIFPVFAFFNFIVILSTPGIGGHHFSDLWGGAALALASIWIVRKYFSEKLYTEIAPVKTKVPAP